MKLFYGWYVVAGAFAVLFCGFGSAYSFGVFFGPLQQEFGATRASVSLVFAIAAALYFSIGALGGMLADRFGPRRVVASGILFMALGLIAASRAASLLQVYVFYGLGVGFGVGMVYVPAVGAVQRWFLRRRGLASGLATMGTGLGTLCVPLIAAALIAAWSWRDAFMTLGIGVLLIGGLGASRFVAEPGLLGLQPDNESALPDAGKRGNGGFTLRGALQTGFFWRLYLSQSLITVGVGVTFAHLVPYAEDLGLNRATAVACLSLVGLGSAAGRLGLGSLADRLGRLRALILFYACLAASYLVWLVATSVWTIAIFAAIFGLFSGGFIAVMPAFIADYFDGPNVSGVIGVQYTAPGVAMLGAPVFAGFVFDRYGSYNLAIIVSFITAVVGLWLLAGLPKLDDWRPLDNPPGSG